MVQILVQLDEDTSRALDKVAPGRSRKRSEFIRLAVRRALMEVQDCATERAYAARPDEEPAHFDPRTWDAWAPQKTRKKKRA